MQKKRASRHLKRKKKSFLGPVIGAFALLILFAISYFVFMKPFDKDENSEAQKLSMSSSSEQSQSSSSLSSSESPENTWINTVAENYLPTFMYHNVSGDTPNNNYVHPENLESALQALKDDGVYTVSTEEAYQILTTNSKPAEKIVWLTFDDGYKDFYDNVFPLLKKYDMHATSFIVTDKVKNEAEGYLTVAEIQEMEESGYVDFQSHTVSHADLNVASDESQTYQLEESKAYLDEILKKETIAICYPSGSHNANTESIATGLGYKMGLLDPGRTYDGRVAINAAAKASDGLFFLNRYRTFTNTDGAAVRAMIAEDQNYNLSNKQN